MVLDFPASTYYAAKQREAHPASRTCRDRQWTDTIRATWEASGRRYGAVKVWQQLRRHGYVIARCTVERLMRAAGMTGAVAERRRPRTTLATAATKAHDLVRRDFTAAAPNRLWVTDLTYVALADQSFCYTAFVTDAFSRAIVGWQVSESLHTELALDALELALWSRTEGSDSGLIHHSDRGVQYTALRYGARLQDSNIAQSVGSVGDSYDNALAESVNALYKKELIHPVGAWTSTTEVRIATAEWVFWYNHQRLHSWCAYQPPLEYEQHWHQSMPSTTEA